MAFSSAFKRKRIDPDSVSLLKLLTPPQEQEIEFICAPKHIIVPKLSPKHKTWDDASKTRCLDDVKGHESAKQFMGEWIKNPAKPLLICGPSGCGKTSLLRTSLESAGYWVWDESLLSENDTICDAIKHFKTTQGFKKTAIVIECIEGIHSEERKGLISAIDEKNMTQIPIIFTADDDFNKAAKLLKRKCTILKLKKLDLAISKKLLIDIAKKHTFSLSLDSADTLIESSQGNLRQAINSMQFMISTKHRQKTIGDSALKECDDKFDIFNILKQICSGVWNSQLEHLIQTDADFFLNMAVENVASCSKTLLLGAKALDSLGISNILLSEVEIDSSRMTKEHYEFSSYIAGLSVSLACRGARGSPNIKFMTFFKTKQDAHARRKCLSGGSDILASHDYFYLKREMFKHSKKKFSKELTTLLKRGLFDETYMKDF